MADDPTEKCLVLADRIAGLLGEEICVGPHVVEYINSTYGNPVFEEIRTLIEEQGGSDRESLLELIFFPDEAVQVQLEQVLERHSYTTEDVAVIAADLAARNIRAFVSIDRTAPALHLRVDRAVIDPFLTRLNIDYSLPSGLNRSLAKIQPVEKRRAVRVRLRNHRTRPTGGLLAFFGRCIRETCTHRYFFQGLDFLLQFVQETDSGADIYEALMRKKRRCRRLLNKIDDAQQKLQKSNVETLLLQGGRIPYIDRRRALETIAAIDRISLAVFGRTESLEPAVPGTDLEIRGADDAAAMIRMLDP